MADHDKNSVDLAHLAHDLRTPLGVMRLTGELIGQGPLDETQREQLSVLIRSIDALEQMTTELVIAAHPNAQTDSPCAPVATIVNDCADLFRISAEAKGLSFDVSIDDNTKSVSTGNGANLRRILVCLLDNAVKYTSAGEIVIAATTTNVSVSNAAGSGRWICISVEDTGPGIDAEERARLFQPFIRGRHGRETGPGTGLGLWGTTQLVKKLGGRLTLTQPEKCGSRFEVLIPVEETKDKRDGKRQSGVSTNAIYPTESAGIPLPTHVLIVDDNETNCRLLAALLESFGITSEVANSGEQAIGFMQQNTYDAVLLDLHMPGMSGVDTAETIRASNNNRSLPLIAVTAALESISDAQLKAAGFQDILTKPLSPTKLYEALVKIAKPTPDL